MLLVRQGFSTSSAGISGLIRRQEAGQRRTSKLSAQAFGDLSALMDAGREMVLTNAPPNHNPPSLRTDTPLVGCGCKVVFILLFVIRCL